ncbi:hypothetical protein ACIQ7D_01910 [Streptomyces sp. NPDC096310]|uniref:hypothetical protein n=1 Tax=Streptomyces sp. NPDC096310 TaxID=3366082 RepID=UPI0037F68D68
MNIGPVLGVATAATPLTLSGGGPPDTGPNGAVPYRAVPYGGGEEAFLSAMGFTLPVLTAVAVLDARLATGLPGPGTDPARGSGLNVRTLARRSQ